MWKRIPVHYVHHRDHMWEHNFGLGVDWWDHVFGTWRAVPFGAVLPIEREQASPFEIHWRRTEGEGQPLARVTERPPVAG
jgi:sterol desaturase/sphingolipid hydroxylase (fatty acid hydroxylase superfamily)